MTHRPSRTSSVSRRNRSRTQTHPQIAVQPTIQTRVKRVSRFRPPRGVSQQQQREDLTWPFPEESTEAFTQHRQPKADSGLSTIVEDPSAIVQRPLDSQSFELVPHNTAQTHNEDPASQPVGSTPTPTHFGLRANSEPSPYLTLQAPSSTEDQFNWTHSPGPRFEVEASQPTADFPQNMSTLGYMSGVAHHFAPLEPAYGSHLDSSRKPEPLV
ncbi:hypothetical protein EJ05DRAFT_240920 [Pseudovirgaria hyperparasitica]|uniref:Uncharacterized protein n=1 Tax=Pseudovirgaria hyperparasitica TaxID=470096 RepID=A0A6A6WFB4_9PEZI|nr:uncharacterized protein EJ05DRAFT_240920 [Pseudovirgaria hyperparasitica]KAF2760724.1 hypothetical protein EJ05DRAFT_240920 [Pseudovirgaria hyperparasitica]